MGRQPMGLTTLVRWGILTPAEARANAETYPAEWLLDIFNGAKPYSRSKPYETKIVTGNEKVLWWAFPAFVGWCFLTLGLVTWLMVR